MIYERNSQLAMLLDNNCSNEEMSEFVSADGRKSKQIVTIYDDYSGPSWYICRICLNLILITDNYGTTISGS